MSQSVDPVTQFSHTSKTLSRCDYVKDLMVIRRTWILRVASQGSLQLVDREDRARGKSL